MIQALIDAFDGDTSSCLTETNSISIEIYDCYDCIPAEQRSYIKINEHQPVHFTLKNNQAENLVFAALDNCILKSHQQSRCDFLIGNFQKLYFVEIKRVNKNQRENARAAAIKQLHASILLLKGKINLANTELIAVICLKATQAYPIQNASGTQKRVAFKDDCNADLMEGQTHTF